MEIEEYKKAWGKFQEKMTSLKKRQFEVLMRITEKLDKQRMDKVIEKLNQ